MADVPGCLRRFFDPLTRSFEPLAALAMSALFAVVVALVGPAPALALGEPADVVAEKPRVAFVIGNNDYANINTLRNPVNDGKLVAGTLKRLHFTVIEGYDMTLADMYKMFADNKPLIDGAEAVVVYYAGHGFQFGQKNYLVPVDATFKNLADVTSETVRLDGLIELLQSEDRPLFLFLDACRNNPLGADEGPDGLAQVETGLNTFVAFATAPGYATKDGRENNSPFARALARSLETPGLSILNLDIAVREETRALTINQQTPWSQQSLLTDFFFSERQTLNPNAVLLAANTILTNGTSAQRDAFQTDLTELGLQGAVMRAQQREVVLQGIDLYNPPPALVAAAEPAATLEISSATAPANPVPVAPTVDATPQAIGTLLFASRSVPGEPVGEGGRVVEDAALRRQLQTELRRLGCYTMTVDGDWGRGSRAALRKYLEAKRLPTEDLEPNLEILDRTVLESGRVCRAPVQVRPVDPRRDPGAAVASRTTPRSESVDKPSRRQRQMQSVQSFRRPAPTGQSAPARKERAERRNEVRRQLGAGFGMGGF